jgi:hypothetical protein
MESPEYVKFVYDSPNPYSKRGAMARRSMYR